MYIDNHDLTNIHTCDLVKELVGREGVAKHCADVGDFVELRIDGKAQNNKPQFGFEVKTGPLIILTIID